MPSPKTHIETVIADLEYEGKEGLFRNDEMVEKGVLTQKEYTRISGLGLYAIFCLKQEVGKRQELDNTVLWKPLVWFFERPENEDNLKKLHQWIWNYGQGAIVFVVDNQANTHEIFNAFALNNDGFLETMPQEKDKEGNDKYHYDFAYLVTGRTFEELENELDRNKRVDYTLLRNLKNEREKLIENWKNNNALEKINKSEEDKKKFIVSLANALLGRVLFICYLIDRKVELHFPTPNATFGREDLINTLKNPTQTQKLFDHLKKYFDTNLFPFRKIENGGIVEGKELISQIQLSIIAHLLEGAEGDQLALPFKYYDFSVIPIEFISNIYEQFIGIENREKQGAYYTPSFLVEQILANTVKKHLFDIEKKDTDCKILDPACGSGIFLVQSLKLLIQKYQILNPDYQTNKEKYTKDLTALIENNIFGIDLDENAVDVTIFSLYLALLDSQEPADIENYELPTLREKNIFKGDFFDTTLSFNQIIKNIDFVVGNPPFSIKTGNNKAIEVWNKMVDKNYHKKKNTKELDLDIIFTLYAKRFAKAETIFSLIIHSTNLYKAQTLSFRKYLLKRFFIDQIFELATVRREVFAREINEEASIAPAVVLTYRQKPQNQPIKDHLIEHISLKPNLFFTRLRLFVIEKYDRQEILQSRLEEDWLFKLLVYGNVLDYHLMQRLLTMPSIYDLISDDNRFIFGKGICENGDDRKKREAVILTNPEDKFSDDYKYKFNTEFLVGSPYISSLKKDLKQFWVRFKDDNVWTLPTTHRERKKELYQIPILIVKKGVDMSNIHLISAVIANPIIIKIKNKETSFNQVAFTDSITSIKALNSDDVDHLYNISAFFSSYLFSYFLLQKASSIGIEREQVHDKEEKFAFPFIFNEKLVPIVKELGQVIESIENPKLALIENDLETKKNDLFKQLNDEIFNTFELDAQERALVDYALKVSIPLVQREKDKAKNPTRVLDIRKKTDKEFLEEYAQVFLNFFEPRLSKPFGVHIYFTSKAIAMKFYIQDSPITEKIDCENREYTDLVNTLFRTAFEKRSTRFYYQKDIKGFEKDGSFYIIKPNEYKVWHRALAYLDASEFNDIINQLKQKRNG